MDDELDVVVATSAFGMGTDKPDIRTLALDAVRDNGCWKHRSAMVGDAGQVPVGQSADTVGHPAGPA